MAAHIHTRTCHRTQQVFSAPELVHSGLFLGHDMHLRGAPIPLPMVPPVPWMSAGVCWHGHGGLACCVTITVECESPWDSHMRVRIH